MAPVKGADDDRVKAIGLEVDETDEEEEVEEDEAEIGVLLDQMNHG